MALIYNVLQQGKQVIVLIPEIALTYQTVSRFYSRFGRRICVMHSRLSAGEKCDQFERARNGETDIMIGARSALLLRRFPLLDSSSSMRSMRVLIRVRRRRATMQAMWLKNWPR